MSCIMKSTILKPHTMSLTSGCLISSLSGPNFTTKSSSNHSSSLSIPFKPIKIHQFSCSLSLPSSSFSFSLFNNHKKSHIPYLIAFVAEDNTVVLEEEGELNWENEGEFSWENEDSDGAAAEAQESEWEGDGGNESAVGDAGESGGGDQEYSEPLEDAKDVNGRLLTVNKAAPKGSRPECQPQEYEPANRIYVGNLPWDVDDARLERVFSERGKVLTARVVYDREWGQSRGFSFVAMSTESELNDAIANLDGQSFNGRAIGVNMA